MVAYLLLGIVAVLFALSIWGLLADVPSIDATAPRRREHSHARENARRLQQALDGRLAYHRSDIPLALHSYHSNH